jgi:hypothetical protein
MRGLILQNFKMNFFVLVISAIPHCAHYRSSDYRNFASALQPLRSDALLSYNIETSINHSVHPRTQWAHSASAELKAARTEFKWTTHNIYAHVVDA